MSNDQLIAVCLTAFFVMRITQMGSHVQHHHHIDLAEHPDTTSIADPQLPSVARMLVDVVAVIGGLIVAGAVCGVLLARAFA